MSDIRRKDLKHDHFIEEVGEAYGFYQRHKQPVLIGAAVVVALIVGISSYFGYMERQKVEAAVALDDAVQLYHGVVTTETREGFITFTTTGERYRRTTEAMEKVKSDFAGMDAAAAADYYIALLEVEQQLNGEAKTRLESVVSNADSTYSSLARLTLAGLLSESGDFDAARVHYQTLIDKPTPVVPASRAKLEMARAMAGTDPVGARALLEELMSEPGPVGAAAGVALRGIPGA